MKKIHVVLLILAILLVDQVFKFYIKTNYYLGEDHAMLGNWFRLHFVENEGMAWGWKLGESGSWGKMALTLFRLLAVFFGVYYIHKIIKEKYPKGFIICVALIFAGAVGNLIDSMFYGMIFDGSDPYTRNIATLFPEGGGYAIFYMEKWWICFISPSSIPLCPIGCLFGAVSLLSFLARYLILPIPAFQ